jgi:ankyrin repeat protein
VDSRSLDGRTPLFFAALVVRSDLVRVLVEEGGEDLDITGNDGNAPGDLYVDWRSSQVKEEIGRLRRL